jgi:tricarballylate dehydrogenase
MTEHANYDLVVLGCGAAGLSAGVSYAAAAKKQSRQARIAILERAPRDGRGGATRWTSAWFRITEDRKLDPNMSSIAHRGRRFFMTPRPCV